MLHLGRMLKATILKRAQHQVPKVNTTKSNNAKRKVSLDISTNKIEALRLNARDCTTQHTHHTLQSLGKHSKTLSQP